jgi:carbon storage regulator CsrA
MLVLGRKVGETVVVPACCLSVSVLEVRGNRVRLGFAAPPQVRIKREEVFVRDKAAEPEPTLGSAAPARTARRAGLGGK